MYGFFCFMLILALLAPMPATVMAGEADVTGVKVEPGQTGTFRFSFTVQHADEGWEHFADRWDLVGPDGEVIASRTLLHPHVDEQPFTRTLDRVPVPGSVARVTVRAHDRLHGLGGREMTVEVPR